jgi:hypothetical protein
VWPKGALKKLETNCDFELALALWYAVSEVPVLQVW